MFNNVCKTATATKVTTAVVVAAEAISVAFIEIMAHFGCVYLTINQIANYEGIVNKYEQPPTRYDIEQCSEKL